MNIQKENITDYLCEVPIGNFIKRTEKLIEGKINEMNEWMNEWMKWLKKEWNENGKLAYIRRKNLVH